jgi:hypothetical protein
MPTTKTARTFGPTDDLSDIRIGDAVQVDESLALTLIHSQDGTPIYRAVGAGGLLWTWTAAPMARWRFYSIGHWPAKTGPQVLADLVARASAIRDEAEVQEIEEATDAYHEEMERQYQMRVRRT